MTNVGNTLLDKARIGDSGDRDARTRNLHLLDLAREQTLHYELNLRAGRTLELRRYLGSGTLSDILTVDFDKLIANLQPRQVRWRALVGLCYDNSTAVALHANGGSNAAILTRCHKFKVVHILLRHILSVRVEVAHHALSAIAHQLIGFNIVDILQRQLAHHVDHNLHVAAEAHIVTHSPHTRHGNSHNKRQRIFPISFHSLSTFSAYIR